MNDTRTGTAETLEERAPARDELLGQRIDALDSAVNAFNAGDVESLRALRAGIRVILDWARTARRPAIARTADRAFHAGPSDLPALAAALIAQLRAAAHGTRPGPRPPPADLDAVTGALNREAFTRRFDELSRAEHAPAAMAAIHVDGYESVRHRHGAQAGRMLLAHVAGIITANLRQDDRLGHFSADEFMVLLPGEDEAGLHAALARLEMAALRSPFRLHGGACESVRITTGGYQFAEGPGGAARRGFPLRVGLAVQNPGIARPLEKLLRLSGCAPVHAGTAAAARYAPFSHHGANLVILECEPPDLPLQLALLRSALLRDRTPILVLTATEAAARWALEHGACDVLVKPVEPDILLNTATRLATRGRLNLLPSAAAPVPVLVASDDLCHLIAMGSALQRHGGFEVRLGRGAADAARRAAQHPPRTALLDLRIRDRNTRRLLRRLAAQDPSRPVVLVTEKGERIPAADAPHPRIAGLMEKPVPLLTLAGEFRRVTGIEGAGGTATSRIFHEELLRVMGGDVR